MKTTVLISTIIGSLLTIVITQSINDTKNSDSQWIVSIRNLTVQDGIDKAEAQEYLESEYLPLFEQLPGVNATIGTPDRGVQKGDFILIYTFDSKWTRDYHFPEEGQYSPEIKEFIENPVYTLFLEKYFTEEGYENYQEYLMFARAK